MKKDRREKKIINVIVPLGSRFGDIMVFDVTRAKYANIRARIAEGTPDFSIRENSIWTFASRCSHNDFMRDARCVVRCELLSRLNHI